MMRKVFLALAVVSLIGFIAGCGGGGGGGGVVVQSPQIKSLKDEMVPQNDGTYIRQITIEWEKVANAASYIVLRKKEGEANFSQIGETSALSYADKLTDSRDFAIDITYQVIAVASDGTKSQPSEVKAENPSPPKPPF
jgi:fibronectin type 3 domain-containing protein